ncbi:zinc ribbon domain-containing protein [Paenibacillus senegalensis]|uniref:zinc ribbon domain-containing protein n=1 Tax=Paenibacillus senegalensis TaxID=1465766 RepID=UPI0002892983|nr:zinc ribbon domain-containing protein [Paenibacillus senegalensis]
MKQFVNKMKLGAAEAAKMAQQAMEITRIKSHISSKEKEVDRYFEAIGEKVFEAYVDNKLERSESFIAEASQQIVRLRREISELEERIKQVKQVKSCPCGRNVPLEANYCPACGHYFESRPPVKVICGRCETFNEENSLYCYNCGDYLMPLSLEDPKKPGQSSSSDEQGEKR